MSRTRARVQDEVKVLTDELLADEFLVDGKSKAEGVVIKSVACEVLYRKS